MICRRGEVGACSLPEHIGRAYPRDSMRLEPLLPWEASMSANVRAQSSTRIEQLAPELEKIISVSEQIQHLAEGFGGSQGPAEGPLWWKEGGYLLFSDIHNSKRMKYAPGSGVSVFVEGTNRANGLTRDLQG